MSLGAPRFLVLISFGNFSSWLLNLASIVRHLPTYWYVETRSRLVFVLNVFPWPKRLIANKCPQSSLYTLYSLYSLSSWQKRTKCLQTLLKRYSAWMLLKALVENVQLNWSTAIGEWSNFGLGMQIKLDAVAVAVAKLKLKVAEAFNQNSNAHTSTQAGRTCQQPRKKMM